MSKNGVIACCLFLSLIVNAYLAKAYFDGRSNRVALEKGILMNEFIDREKKLGNFRALVVQLAAKSDKLAPVSQEQLSAYRLLASPGDSTIMSPTYEFRAKYEPYDDDLAFLQQFDSEYKGVVDGFITKLPFMNKEQLAAAAKHMDAICDLYMDQALRDWMIRRNGSKVHIRFNPPQAVLNQVIQELRSIREELEAVQQAA
ncbi:hypothetical protein GXP70_01420 [Paenibacillus lycopersici]|uniref:Uncharacterized protein n=1 Tax=Paenibacillus lycopersici TaxID=2704462 RepID=A0A6C0G281_9BACL|nr:hypothetical protein [Paenibacillus lycopersici]QHT58765.1 hypothetical protein GXP70_01420 [Paenibacillus lycopersici]